jgi:hypothetical protein
MRLMVAVALTHLIGWIYTISAIEFALACVAVEFLGLLRAPHWNSVARLATSALLLGAAALIHPALIGALDIAGNDGAISVSLPTLIIGGVTLLVGIVALDHFCRDTFVHRDAFIALGLSALLACTLQAFAFGALNLGSLYAVKKYGFLLGTMAIGVWSVMVARWLPDSRWRPARLPVWGMVLLFAVGGLGTVAVGRPKTPIEELIAYDRQVKSLVAVHPELFRQSVSWNTEQTAHINYMIGTAVLQPTALIDQHAVFLPLLYSGATRYVILESGAAADFAPECIETKDSGLIAVRSYCFSPKAGFGKQKS